MKQLKNTIKNNILLGLAVCVAMSSTVAGCGCDSEPEEGKKNTAKVLVTPDSGILKAHADTAIVKLKREKDKDELKYENVTLNFEGNANFVKDGEKTALPAKMNLSEFLKKDAEEAMGDTEYELKFKVIEPLPKQDATLKLSVGNSENPTAYAAQVEVVKYQVTLPQEMKATALTPIINNYTTGDITVTVESTGPGKVKREEVFVTFGGLACLKFKKKVNGVSTPLTNDAVKLSTLVANLGNGDLESPVNITLVIDKTETLVDNETLEISLGTQGAPTSYIDKQKIMTAEIAGVIIPPFTVTTVHSGTDSPNASFSVAKSGKGELKTSNLFLKFEGTAASNQFKIAKFGGGGTIAIGPNAIQLSDIDASGGDVDITSPIQITLLKASGATLANGDELLVKVGKSLTDTSYVPTAVKVLEFRENYSVSMVGAAHNILGEGDPNIPVSRANVVFRNDSSVDLRPSSLKMFFLGDKTDFQIVGDHASLFLAAEDNLDKTGGVSVTSVVDIAQGSNFLPVIFEIKPDVVSQLRVAALSKISGAGNLFSAVKIKDVVKATDAFKAASHHNAEQPGVTFNTVNQAAEAVVAIRQLKNSDPGLTTECKTLIEEIALAFEEVVNVGLVNGDITLADREKGIDNVIDSQFSAGGLYSIRTVPGTNPLVEPFIGSLGGATLTVNAPTIELAINSIVSRDNPGGKNLRVTVKKETEDLLVDFPIVTWRIS